MSHQENTNLFIDFLKNKNFQNREHLNKSLNKISNINQNLPLSHRISINKENAKTNIINYGNSDIKNNIFGPTYDIYKDYQLMKKFGPNLDLINKIRNESSNIQKQNKINNFDFSNLKNNNNIYNYNSNNTLNKNIPENVKELFKEKINRSKIKDFNNYNNTINFENINKYKSNKSMDKIRSNSSQKLSNNNFFYYFDYKNDNYNEIREKSKDKELSTLNNIPDNNKLFRTFTDINIQTNNQNNLRNKILNVNSQNKLLTERNNKNFSRNILNDYIGTNYNSQNNTIGNIYQNENKNIGEDLVSYLKKENEELKNENLKNNQIINTVFYFINQLSQQYSTNKKTFNYSYYSNHLNELMQDLNNLNNNINMKKGENTQINQIEYFSNKNNNIGEILSDRFSLINKNISNPDIKKMNNIEPMNNKVINTNNSINNTINNKYNNNMKINEKINKNNNTAKNIENINSNVNKKNSTLNEKEIIHSLNNIIYK